MTFLRPPYIYCTQNSEIQKENIKEFQNQFLPFSYHTFFLFGFFPVQTIRRIIVHIEIVDRANPSILVCCERLARFSRERLRFEVKWMDINYLVLTNKSILLRLFKLLALRLPKE